MRRGLRDAPRTGPSRCLTARVKRCDEPRGTRGGRTGTAERWVAPPRTDFGSAAAGTCGPLQRVGIRLGVGRRRAADYAGNLYGDAYQSHAAAGGHGAWRHVELRTLDLRRPHRIRPLRRTLQPRPVVYARA